MRLDWLVISILHLAEIAAARQIMNDIVGDGFPECVLSVDAQGSWPIAVYYSHLCSQALCLHPYRICIILRTIKSF